MYHVIISRYSISISMSRKNLGYPSTDHAMYRIISMRYFTWICTSSSFSACMACVFVSVHTQAWNNGISMQIDRRKRAAHYTVLGGLHGNQFDASDLMRGKKTSGKFWTCDMQFLAISTTARTAVAKEEECLLCDSEVMSYKMEGAWQGIG